MEVPETWRTSTAKSFTIKPKKRPQQVIKIIDLFVEDNFDLDIFFLI